MGDEEESNGKVPWRAVTLSLVGTLASGGGIWLYVLTGYVQQIRDQQVANTRSLEELRMRDAEHQRRFDTIESTKTDRRFRSDDWDRERRVLDEQFRGVWKAIEDCKRPAR